MMLDTTSAFSLTLAMALMAALPSVSTLAVASRAAGSGFSSGAAVAAGIVSGDVIFILVAMLGLAALTEALGPLFAFVRVLGGAYLVWMGVRLWLSARSLHDSAARGAPASSSMQHSSITLSSNETRAGSLAETISRRTIASDFLAGLLLTLGDQKAILFYLGFLPAFVDLSRITTADIVLVPAVAVLAVGTVKLGYAWIAWRAGSLSLLRASHLLPRLAATALVPIGVLLVGSALFVR